MIGSLFYFPFQRIAGIFAGLISPQRTVEFLDCIYIIILLFNSSGDTMNTIPGWDGPRQRSGRDQICYWRIVGQRMGQGSEQRIIELFSQGVLPKRMFIKVKSSNFSGGVLFMPEGELLPRTEGPWEAVLESGKWIRYDLEIAIVNDDLVIEHGDLKFARLGTGKPINENIGSIEEMAAWLDKQMEK